MRYNRTLYESLGKRLEHNDGATTVNGLFLATESLHQQYPGGMTVYLNVENSLYHIGGFDIHEMEIDNKKESVICITAKIPEWLSEYNTMNTEQLIKELGVQSTRRATAMYGCYRVDFATRSDADDRITYINELLMKLRFSNRNDDA